MVQKLPDACPLSLLRGTYAGAPVFPVRECVTGGVPPLSIPLTFAVAHLHHTDSQLQFRRHSGA